MNQTLLSVLSLMAGAGLGLASSLLVSFFKQRQTVVLRLLDQYLEVRKDLVDTISDLTHIPNTTKLTEERRGELQDKIARLFYRHYDFLPREVLDALLLLNVCLSDTSGKLYELVENVVIPMDSERAASFIERCSIYRNAQLIAPVALRSKEATVRYNQAAKLHARHVLYTLNQFASLKDFMKMASRFPKAGRLGRSKGRALAATNPGLYSRLEGASGSGEPHNPALNRTETALSHGPAG